MHQHHRARLAKILVFAAIVLPSASLAEGWSTAALAPGASLANIARESEAAEATPGPARVQPALGPPRAERFLPAVGKARQAMAGPGILDRSLTAGSAGANAPPTASSSVEAHDSRGVVIRLAQPARRVVTLAPHATELLAAAGGLGQLVGAIRDDDQAPTEDGRPSVGDAFRIDPERLAALQPDLIVGWLESPLHMLQSVLETLDIPVFISAPRRLDEIPGQIEALGVLMGTTDVAHHAAAQWRQRLERLRISQAERQPLLDVFLEIGHDPLYTLNRDHVIDEVLTLCGARNVFANAPLVAPQVELEDLLRRRPDVILVTRRPEPAARQAARHTWRRLAPALPAAADPLLIDPDWLVRPGPRLLDGAEALCRELDERRARGAAHRL
ncbi:MAG: helical backbone metal receptor [Pigmentiphaga sp.]|nr:helical backbone metal receptor [Pigmentiphaga sp.]